jgi:hypothetical protein
MQPTKDVLDDYTKSVAFLKGLTITEKLVINKEFVIFTKFLTKILCSLLLQTKLLLLSFCPLVPLHTEIQFQKKSTTKLHLSTVIK